MTSAREMAEYAVAERHGITITQVQDGEAAEIRAEIPLGIPAGQQHGMYAEVQAELYASLRAGL